MTRAAAILALLPSLLSAQSIYKCGFGGNHPGNDVMVRWPATWSGHPGFHSGISKWLPPGHPNCDSVVRGSTSYGGMRANSHANIDLICSKGMPAVIVNAFHPNIDQGIAAGGRYPVGTHPAVHGTLAHAMPPNHPNIDALLAAGSKLPNGHPTVDVWVGRPPTPPPTNPPPTASCVTSITTTTLAQHATAADCWIAINNKVYDFTNYAVVHPGGQGAVTSHCGTDGTDEYNAPASHSSVKPFRGGSFLGWVCKGVLTTPPPVTQPTTRQPTNPPPTAAPVQAITCNTNIAASTIKLHTTVGDCWVVLYKKVWDFSTYMGLHGGGTTTILPVCGRDGTFDYAGAGAFHSIPFSETKGTCVGSVTDTELAKLGGAPTLPPTTAQFPTYAPPPSAPPTNFVPTPVGAGTCAFANYKCPAADFPTVDRYLVGQWPCGGTTGLTCDDYNCCQECPCYLSFCCNTYCTSHTCSSGSMKANPETIFCSAIGCTDEVCCIAAAPTIPNAPPTNTPTRLPTKAPVPNPTFPPSLPPSTLPPTNPPPTSRAPTVATCPGQVQHATMALHSNAGDCWMELQGKVYDLTGYLNQHPAGPGTIVPYCGSQATAQYDGIGSHSGVKPFDGICTGCVCKGSYVAEPPTAPPSPLAVAPSPRTASLSRYPTLDPSYVYTISGTVAVTESAKGGNLLDVTLNVGGLQPGSTGGVHVHQLAACGSDGGHYWNPTIQPDPWNAVKWTADNQGNSVQTIYEIDTGYSASQMDGHAVTLHDSAGIRVACGVLPSATPIGSPPSPNLSISYSLTLTVARPAAKMQGMEVYLWLQDLAVTLSIPFFAIVNVNVNTDQMNPNQCRVTFNTGATDYAARLTNAFVTQQAAMERLDVVNVMGGVASPTPLGDFGSPIGAPYIASIGVYPGYNPGIRVTGSISVFEMPNGLLRVQYNLAGIPPNQNGAVHIHTGITCSQASSVGGHYFDNSLGFDPWTLPVSGTNTEWTSSSDGLATGRFDIRSGYPLQANLNHAMVVHYGADKIGCGLLLPQGTQLGAASVLTPHSAVSAFAFALLLL